MDIPSRKTRDGSPRTFSVIGIAATKTSCLLIVDFVGAAHFGGGQAFAPSQIKKSHYQDKLGLATHRAKLVSYCITWPPPTRKAPETHVEISTAPTPGRVHLSRFAWLGSIAGSAAGPRPCRHAGPSRFHCRVPC